MNNYFCSNRFCQAPSPLLSTLFFIPPHTPTYPYPLPTPHPSQPPTPSHSYPLLFFLLSSIYISNILTMSYISQFFSGLIQTFSCGTRQPTSYYLTSVKFFQNILSSTEIRTANLWVTRRKP